MLPIRILFIAHHQNLSGANQSLLNLLEGLALFYPGKYVCHVILPKNGQLAAALAAQHIPCTIIRFSFDALPDIPVSFFKRALLLARHSRRQLRAMQKIRQVIKNLDMDVVHTNSSVISIGWWAAKLSGKPHIWHIREFTDIPFGYKYLYGKRMQVRLLKASQAVVVISKSLQDYYRTYYKVKTQLIYNGLFLEGAAPAKKVRQMNQPLVLAVVGNIIPAKNQLEAIQLLSHLLPHYPQVQLRLIGEIPQNAYAQMLREYITAHRLQEYIQFTGFVNHMEAAYAEMDVLISCSKNEAFGRTLVEAACKGIPVIARNCGGVAEIVTDTSIGYLYNHTDELLAAVLKVLKQVSLQHENPEPWVLPASLQQFTINRYAGEMDTLIAHTLNTGGKGLV